MIVRFLLSSPSSFAVANLYQTRGMRTIAKTRSEPLEHEDMAEDDSFPRVSMIRTSCERVRFGLEDRSGKCRKLESGVRLFHY